MTGIVLVDYPAKASPETQEKIDAFLAACRSIRDAHTEILRRSRIDLAVSLSRIIRARRDELADLLYEGDLWLLDHPDEDDEAQWFTAEAEHRAIWDALEEGLHIAFGRRPSPEQARMMGVA